MFLGEQTGISQFHIFDGNSTGSKSIITTPNFIVRKGARVAAGIGILIYGKDERLLDTRRMVLERFGYRVSMGSTLSAVKLLGGRSINLLMLCHTVSTEEGERVMALAKEQWPEARKLIITAGELDWSATSSNEVFSAADGPEMMIAAVRRTVGMESSEHVHACSRVNEGGPYGTIRRDSEVV